MTIAELLDRLGYTKSENYLRKDRGDFDSVVDYGHLFRRAAEKPCNLQGVYALNGPGTAIPIVYVCDVKSESELKEAHRLVWNQGAVPFIIVNNPETVRVYPGFCREGPGSSSASVRAVQREFGKAPMDRIAETLSAIAVDSGNTWRSWGRFIRPEHRVDWRLLDNLGELDTWLQKNGLQRGTSHALIGKYVYLCYLRDREILSPRKFDRFRIPQEAVFGREATVEGLKAVSEELDGWLNGEVFPIAFSGRNAPGDKHVSRVAATFNGEKPLDDNYWQLHLDFQAYDFSYIPIEVLSVVYEQFLHAPEEQGTRSGGRAAGAYYTPIPVVNLMLSEVEERCELKRGMRVFDPACGSGAFLVQAFRRLIEREFPPNQGRPSPVGLRELLEGHFYGLDTDLDACNVTRLSLILTLLDYVRPPDLEMDDRPGPNPRLPNLRNNIFCGNFFDDAGDWRRVFARKKADWVVGNPPWKQLKKGNIREEDKPVLVWMKTEEKHRPVGNRQTARAFAWRVAEYVGDDGEIALFLPAMTLFEEAAKGFRSRFLQDMSIHTIVNFSNLRRLISAKRFTAPAAAFFYHRRSQQDDDLDAEESIRTYSPLVANQEATRPLVKSRRNETWSVVLNASEIRDVPLSSVVDGHGLPWKVAFWGSNCDARLLGALQRRFERIGEMEKKKLLVIKEGPQLKDGDPTDPPKGMEPAPELLGKLVLNVRKVEGLRDCFAFPKSALEVNRKQLLRLRGGKAGLAVCRPPHVLVSAARSFAIYSDEFIIVPPRQIGVISPTGDKNLLKALSVFLSSDFAFYFEFFVSTAFGIERDRSTLKALRKMPTPLKGMDTSELDAWADLHDRLAKASREACRNKGLWKANDHQGVVPNAPVLDASAMKELNDLVYNSLGLAPDERALVEDMVHVRLALNDGRLGKAAVDQPTQADLRAYGSSLQEELDDYIGDEVSGRHNVQIIHDNHSGMVCIALVRNATGKGRVSVLRADASEAAALEKYRKRIRQEKGQWVYFDRNLRVYDGDSTYILKPMQRFHWTRSQARVDAMDIVPESMARRDEA